jgi:asparagine synthase (glutamine-hydrolysing)
MCGIIGIIAKEKKLNFNINGALLKLNHRGPNNTSYEELELENCKLIFGHTRLSIIDLTNEANQPMYNSGKSILLTFNGEIYNYLELKKVLIENGYNFKTNSDTEVLINSWDLWGEKCLRLFKGMFSFAIYCQKQNKVFLVRDAFGIKPLYYKFENNILLFSSEIPPILELSKNKTEPNWNSVHRYLVNSEYDQDKQTFFKDIFQINPSSLIEFNLNNFNLIEKKWWTPTIDINRNILFNDAKIKLKQLFFENIKLHLRSDVPIAFALSGGIDSSALVCGTFLENNIKIPTFSYIDTKKTYDESKWINIVNKKVKSLTYQFSLDQSDLSRDLKKLIKAQGEPFASTSVFAQYKVFEEMSKNGYVVSIDGQGADELFAGYNGFPGKRFKSIYYEYNIIKALQFIFNWSKNPNHNLIYGIFASASEFIPEKHKIFFLKLIGRNQNPKYLNKKFAPFINDISNEENFDKKRSLVNELKKNLQGKGLGSYLRHADRNSMTWSIESRVPFLTIDLAEFILSLPENYLLSDNGETKYIFRKSLEGIVPNEILNRKDKIGFRTNEKDFLKSNFELLNFCLTIAKEIPIFNNNFEKYFRKLFKKGKAWKIINFCIWYDIYIKNNQNN